ncbi:MAG: DUF932 domain-containing protein [Phycisphaera sp.]|nr:DUF932 domain-containing protein [Phycisphaera sp.]
MIGLLEQPVTLTPQEPVAWQRSGVTLDEAETPDDVIDAAGLNWTVAKVPLRTDDENCIAVPKRFAVVRQDKRFDQAGVLGIVGDSYKPVDNAVAVAFFHELVRTAGATYRRGGMVTGGQRVYLIADLPEPIEVVPGDTVQRTLLMVNSHNGSTALRVLLSPIRVVCLNQLAVATRRGRGFSIRHGRDVQSKMNEAGAVIAKLSRAYDRTAEAMRAMARRVINARQLTEFYDRVLPMPYDDKQRQNHARKLQRLTELYEGGIGSRFARGSLWGAVNSVTELIDHNGRRSVDPVNSALFGSGASLKQRAYSVAEQMLKSSLN